MKKEIFIVFLIFILFSFFAQNKLDVYDFEKVKQLALKNNLSLKNYENQMKLSELSYKQAVSNLYFPYISINSSTNIPFNQDKISNASINLNISKPIFNGFTLQKAKDLAYLNFQYKKNIYESKVLETKYLAFQYYYTYLIKLLQYNLYREILKIDTKRLNEYETKYKLGLITELDYISLKLTFSKIEISFKNAENEKDLAYLTLKSFLNLNTDFTILEQQNFEKIDFSKLFNKKSTETTNLENENCKVETFINDAKKYDSTYISALYSYIQAQINLKYYIASLLPSLSSALGLSYSGFFYDGQFKDSEPSISISLSISIDLDSLIPGSSKSMEKKALEKEVENTKLNLEKAEKELVLNLETKLKNLNLGLKNKENALNTYEYANKGYKLATDAFNLGQISASTFSSWEEDYINAKIFLYSAILNYQLAIESLLMMIGKN